jgi:hypothetical protein
VTHRLVPVSGVVLALGFFAASYAQPDSAWMFKYPGTGQGTYQPLASFVDDTGNIYIAGWSQKGEDRPRGFFLLKIDSSGHLTWDRTYEHLTATGAARDTTGSIYISGGDGRHLCLLKYNRDGGLQWARTYGEAGKSYPALGSIAFDDSQNVYACGVTYSDSGTGDAVHVVKYLPSGELAKVIGYTLPRDMSLHDGEFHVLGNGDVYLALDVGHPIRWEDWLVVKLSSNGIVDWERNFRDTDSTWEEPRWSQVDGRGNIYITGITTTPTNKPHCSFRTMKMDSSSSIVWNSEYNAPESTKDEAYFLKFDRGNVYVAGWSVYGFGEECAITLLKYDSLGSQLWASQYGKPNSDCYPGYGYDGLEAKPPFCPMNIDDSGNVYVTGEGIDDSGLFAVLLKYDAQGRCVWVRKRPEQNGAWWTGATVSLDNRGAVFDIGTYGASGERWGGIYVLKYRTR